MLIKLNPGIICKECGDVMTMGRDRASNVNFVINEDKPIMSGDFDCIVMCIKCMKNHICRAFIRDGEFKGIASYEEEMS